MKKQWLIGAMALAQVIGSAAVRADGDKGHGTESEKLYLKTVLADPSKAKRYHEAAAKIEAELKQGTFKTAMLAFLKQVPAEKIHSEDVRRMLAELRRQATAQGTTLEEEVQRSRYVVQDKPCLDHRGIPREAVTANRPGAETCVYPKGLALLYVMYCGARATLEPLEPLLFGVLSHELARKYSAEPGTSLPLDDDHGFLLAMTQEIDKHWLVLDPECYETRPYCEMRSLTGMPGPISYSPALGASRIKATITVEQPPKDGMGEWKKCIKPGNFVLVTHHEPSKKGRTVPRGLEFAATPTPGVFEASFEISQLPAANTDGWSIRPWAELEGSVLSRFDAEEFRTYVSLVQAEATWELYSYYPKTRLACAKHTVRFTTEDGALIQENKVGYRYPWKTPDDRLGQSTYDPVSLKFTLRR